MPIDPTAVEWDAPPAIDPSAVQWDPPPKRTVRGVAVDVTSPVHDMSTMERLNVGAGQSVAATGRGLGQLLRSTVGDTAGNWMGLPTQADVDEAAAIDKPLLKTPAGMVGSMAGQVAQMALPVSVASRFAPVKNAASAVTAALPRVAPYLNAAAQGGVFAGAQPVVTGDTRTGNALAGAAFGAAGQAVGSAATKYLTRSTAKGAEAAAANAVRDATLAAGRDAGYVVTPAQAGAKGPVNAVLEGLGGKIKTQQAASVKNAEVTNKLARQALGLPDNAPITPELLAAVRQKAGTAFERLKQTGTVTADGAYGKALDDIVQKYQGASSAFPGLAKPELEALVTSLKQPQFGSDAAVDAIRVLRENATAAYAKGDKGLGKATREASDALESMMERHLAEGGKGAMLKEFREARKLIAKTYSVEDALIKGSGDVSARRLGAKLAKGTPLTDELRTAGQFANTFPKAAQDAVDVPPWSILDMVGASGATMGGAPQLAALLAARPVARASVLNPLYQRTMVKPSYGPGLAARVAAPTLDNDIARYFLTAGGLAATQ